MCSVENKKLKLYNVLNLKKVCDSEKNKSYDY